MGGYLRAALLVFDLLRPNRYVFWCAAVALPVTIFLAGIWVIAYRDIPLLPVSLIGDPIVIYDDEIGFVPRPQTRSERVHRRPDGSVQFSYHIYTDTRGARVSTPTQASPPHVEMLFVGDSFTWGQGVENEDTFAARVAHTFRVPIANISMGSYATTQALQTLHRNLDLAPKTVIHAIIADTARRNISPCAPSYLPFCIDSSYVARIDKRLQILPPRSNGIRRIQVHAAYQHDGLDPITWTVHGADVIYGLLLARAAKQNDTEELREAAFTFLLKGMRDTVQAMGARLIVLYLPTATMLSLDPYARTALATLNVPFLDLSDSFRRHQAEHPEIPLFIPDEGHPSTAGHKLISEEITSFIHTTSSPKQ